MKQLFLPLLISLLFSGSLAFAEIPGPGTPQLMSCTTEYNGSFSGSLVKFKAEEGTKACLYYADDYISANINYFSLVTSNENDEDSTDTIYLSRNKLISAEHTLNEDGTYTSVLTYKQKLKSHLLDDIMPEEIHFVMTLSQDNKTSSNNETDVIDKDSAVLLSVEVIIQ